MFCHRQLETRKDIDNGKHDERAAAGNFPTLIFDVVLKRITLRGSIVSTGKDLVEAIEFAAEGKVRAHILKHCYRSSAA
jgi:D-arabinose 1-dehydrogenase-like Zn-dependent alcohol dehydrogenase